MQSFVQQENFYNNSPEEQQRLFTEQINDYAEMQLKDGDGIIHNISIISNRGMYLFLTCSIKNIALHIHRQDLFQRAEAPETKIKMEKLRRDLRELIIRKRPERDIMLAEKKVKDSETSLFHLREDVHLMDCELYRRNPQRYNHPPLAPTLVVNTTRSASDKAPAPEDVNDINAIRISLNAEVKDYLNQALQVYRSKKCSSGQITSEEDFKFVVRECSTAITGELLKLKVTSLSKNAKKIAAEHWYV